MAHQKFVKSYFSGFPGCYGKDEPMDKGPLVVGMAAKDKPTGFPANSAFALNRWV